MLRNCPLEIKVLVERYNAVSSPICHWTLPSCFVFLSSLTLPGLRDESHRYATQPIPRASRQTGPLLAPATAYIELAVFSLRRPPHTTRPLQYPFKNAKGCPSNVVGMKQRCPWTCVCMEEITSPVPTTQIASSTRKLPRMER